MNDARYRREHRGMNAHMADKTIRSCRWIAAELAEQNRFVMEKARREMENHLDRLIVLLGMDGYEAYGELLPEYYADVCIYRDAFKASADLAEKNPKATLEDLITAHVATLPEALRNKLLGG
jgi:hypothetical protein